MKTTKSFGEYPKYSLHDARVQKIEYEDDNLILTFEYIFSYEDGVEQTHKAQVVFETCDIDDLEILVFMFYFLYPCIVERILKILSKRSCDFHMLQQ